MPTFTTHVTYYARPVIDRSDIRFEGLTGDEEDYGRVKIVKRTVQERRASGDVGRLLDSRESEEVVIESLTAREAQALIGGLSRAVVDALTVSKPRG